MDRANVAHACPECERRFSVLSNMRRHRNGCGKDLKRTPRGGQPTLFVNLSPRSGAPTGTFLPPSHSEMQISPSSHSTSLSPVPPLSVPLAPHSHPAESTRTFSTNGLSSSPGECGASSTHLPSFPENTKQKSISNKGTFDVPATSRSENGNSTAVLDSATFLGPLSPSDSSTAHDSIQPSDSAESIAPGQGSYHRKKRPRSEVEDSAEPIPKKRPPVFQSSDQSNAVFSVTDTLPCGREVLFHKPESFRGQGCPPSLHKMSHFDANRRIYPPDGDEFHQVKALVAASATNMPLYGGF